MEPLLRPIQKLDRLAGNITYFCYCLGLNIFCGLEMGAKSDIFCGPPYLFPTFDQHG